MGSTNGPETDPLSGRVLEELRADPFGFDFFRAVRRLESEFRQHPRVGRSTSPSQDPVRFGQGVGLAFATSTLEGLEEGSKGGRPRLLVNCFGLLGPNGPMPLHITEYLRERLRNFRDGAGAAFLNIFHHRMLGFFYRAWAVNQKAADFDRPEESRYSSYFGSLIGLGERSLCNRDHIPEEAKLYYAGPLADQVRSSEGLEGILGEYFRVPVLIESLMGGWMAVPAQYRTRLEGGSTNTALGETAILGERVWDVQSRFRVVLGPMSLERFRTFLPGERAMHRLDDWIRLYLNDEFEWDLQLLLEAKAVPPAGLGIGSMLGWTAWLEAGERTSDAGDLVTINHSSERRNQVHNYERN